MEDSARKFKVAWYDNHPWLEYSQRLNKEHNKQIAEKGGI